MIDQEMLVHSITEATAEVFSTMLDLQVRYVGITGNDRARESGIISLVGITGEWGGSGVFCCAPALANILCARMLGNQFDAANAAIDEEVRMWWPRLPIW